MKTISALDIKNGDTIETSNGHIFEDVYVELDTRDGVKVDVYGQNNAIKLPASQFVWLITAAS